MQGGSWLFPDGVDRERMLELDLYLQPVRKASFAVLALALVACGPWLGWWTLVPLALAVVVFRIGDHLIPRARHPEYALLASWAGSQVIMASSVALTGGPKVPTLAWLCIPMLTVGARFSERGIAVGVIFTLALMFATAFGVDAQAVLDNPTLIIAPVALLICVAMFQTVLMRSDLKYRAEAVIDQLTGMLNRKALIGRVAELEQQSQLSREPIGLIVADIDHFKNINDGHGHAAGDAVLKDVAYELRKQLRAFDLSYRIGGEEFLILLPGAARDRTFQLAEELRARIAAWPWAGHSVTMSFGVSASEAGEAFDYESAFEEADSALYEAKRSGRNRVCSVDQVEPAATAALVGAV
jgi:diguanylate cyclase (GGDEF)-like protein